MSSFTSLSDRINKAVNEECSCGGRDPWNEPCVACRVWHWVWNPQTMGQVQDGTWCYEDYDEQEEDDE